MTANTLRLDRALALLHAGEDATAEALADALWLARFLPPPAPEDESGQVTDPAPERPDAAPEAKPATPSNTGQSNLQGKAPEPTGALFAAPSVPVDGPSLPATFISVPAADSLPNRLALERALKPFLKRFPSRRLRQLDSDATAKASADRRGNITPVFTPLPERWFDVLLMVEKSDAMEVWSETVRELRHMLGRHGAFRKVRVLRFAVKADQVALFTSAGHPLSSNTAADPDGRTLCLFLTNGTSAEWRRPPLIDFLRSLGRRTVVAIIQMLPQRAWGHTALGDALERLHSVTPGAPNAALRLEDPFSGISRALGNTPCVPVLTLEYARASAWARFVMSPRRVSGPAVMLEALPAVTAESGRERTAAERLTSFRSIASRGAFQLLRMLAGAPLTLPIMRLIQQSSGEAREQFHLAEVMLSGLIERTTPPDSSLPPDQVCYDFVPGIRELLLGTLSSRESDAIDSAMQPARERVRAFVERQTGRAIRDFRALIADPEGTEQLPAAARSFVEVNRRIYELRGILPRSTGVPPVDAAPQTIAIEPRVLSEGAPVLAAAVSGQGKYVVSVTESNGGRVIRIRERETGVIARDVPLERDQMASLFPQTRSDDVYALSSQVLILLGTDSSIRRPVRGGFQGMTPDGHLWTFRIRIPLAQPNAAAAGREIGLAGFPSGEVQTWQVDDQDPTVTRTIAKFSVPVTAVCISDDGAKGLALRETGGVSCFDIGVTVTQNQLPVSDASSIAMTADGGLALVGHESGIVTLWRLPSPDPVARLRQGTAPVRTVSLSAAGQYAVSASDDGLKSWDLSGIVSAPLPKSRVPRRVWLIPSPADERLSRLVRNALTEAGHETVSAAGAGFALSAPVGGWDYAVQVLASSEAPAPFPVDALPVRSESQIPHLLDELDLNPKGVLLNMPPEIVGGVARPKTEANLTAFLLNQAISAPEVYLRHEPNSGSLVTLARVLRTDEIRRAYWGGIHWDVQPVIEPRERRKLVVRIMESPGATDPGSCTVIRSVEAGTPRVKAPVFPFPLLSVEESANHLRRAGMTLPQVEAAVAFHRQRPVLVGVAAGAYLHGIPLEPREDEDFDAGFDRILTAALSTLSDPVRAGIVRLSAISWNESSFRDYLPLPDPAVLKFATDFGALFDSSGIPSLVPKLRELIGRLYPKEVASVHETIVSTIEKNPELVRPPRSNFFFSTVGIDHALAAGGIPRLEAFLRNRLILSSWSKQNLTNGFATRLEPLAAESAFLRRIVDLLKSGQFVTDDLLDKMLAPLPQWPALSGIADAHAQGFTGEGISVAIPGTGCDPSHPEFAGRTFPPNLSDAATYGTEVCSVVGGINIGVAPGAMLQPVVVMGSDLKVTAQSLLDAITRYLDDPPAILCLTFTYPPDETASPMRQVIADLTAKDILVISAAGNGGEGKFSRPAIFPEVLTVGACDLTGRISAYSSRGTYTGPDGPRAIPDLYGYGTNITVAKANRSYDESTGTTIAAAYVAGIAALYAQATGTRGQELRQLLIRTADPQTRIARFALSTDNPAPNVA